MIAILGASASGKTSMIDLLLKSDKKYRKIVTYTTRPKRPNEVDGVDYFFVTENAFKELSKRDFFIEQATYNNWHYGTAKKDCTHSDYTIAILTPAGLRNLRNANIKTTAIYLYVDRASRLCKSIKRGDNVDEAYRRNLSDVGQFDGVENEVEYIIDNTSYHLSPMKVLLSLKAILKEVHSVEI